MPLQCLTSLSIHYSQCLTVHQAICIKMSSIILNYGPKTMHRRYPQMQPSTCMAPTEVLVLGLQPAHFTSRQAEGGSLTPNSDSIPQQADGYILTLQLKVTFCFEIGEELTVQFGKTVELNCSVFISLRR